LEEVRNQTEQKSSW